MQTPSTTASLPTFNKGARYTKMFFPLTCAVHAVRFQHPQSQEGA